MKFGDHIQGTIERLDDKGRGVFLYAMPIATDGTRNVAVPFTMPGDRITAKFVRRDQGFWIAELERVDEPAPNRVATKCPHAGTCGGCLWQHIRYETQLEIKRDMINAAFKNAGHEEQIMSVMPSKNLFYYRNRMDYPFGWKNEIGLKAYGRWNAYVDVKECFLLDEETPKILETVRELCRELHLTPWDAKRHEGLMRYVVIRRGEMTDERLIVLVVKELTAFDEGMRQEITRRLLPFCTTLYLGENPEITDLSYTKTFVLLHGNEYLTEEVNGLRYRIHPNSFFQTNSRMAAELQNTVLTFLGDVREKKIFDLYCGLGFFGIACATHGARVHGHELDATAIELAKENAKLNGVGDKTTWTSGPTEDFGWEETPVAVIIDPPRSGLHPRALKTLLEKKPEQIVYVSCNFHRLAEELTQLKTIYRIEHLAALDLFPHTPHVETVVSLRRISRI